MYLPCSLSALNRADVRELRVRRSLPRFVDIETSRTAVRNGVIFVNERASWRNEERIFLSSRATVAFERGRYHLPREMMTGSAFSADRKWSSTF